MRGLLALCLLAIPLAASAQDTSAVKLHLTLEEGAHIGRAAPQVALPYATADSAGPATQPFDLAKELGHVVVLVFYPGDATARSNTDWQAFGAHESARAGTDVVVAGIAPGAAKVHVAFARRAGVPFKFLSDDNRLTARRYGMSRTAFAVVVIDRGGRVAWVEPRFAVTDPASYVHLDAAIAAARKEP